MKISKIAFMFQIIRSLLFTKCINHYFSSRNAIVVEKRKFLVYKIYMHDKQ